MIVVTWNGAALLPACLDGLRAQRGAAARLRTWVVDNASTDGTADLLAARYRDVRLIRNPINVGFAGGCNRALREVDTPFAVLLNNDAVPEPDWLDRLLTPFTAPGGERLAAVTPKVLFAADGRVNNAGGVVRKDGYAYDRGFGEPAAGRYDTPIDVFAFSGTAAALRSAALRDSGLLAEEFFTYYEDTDLSWRLRLAGWKIRYEPAAVVHHLHAATSDLRSRRFAFYNERNRLLMLTRNAPASTAVRQVVRFLATTLLLALRRLLGVPVPRDHQFRTALRMGVLGSYLRLLPHSLHARREIGRRARVRRRAVTAELEPAPPRARGIRVQKPTRRFGAQSSAGSVESSLHGTGSQETLPANRA